MASVQPHLASWERRLLALALDTVLVLIVGSVLAAALMEVGSRAMAVSAMAVVYILYESHALLRPQYSWGRTVANVVVVRTGGAELSVRQAVARPLVRLVLFAAPFAMNGFAYGPWPLALPFVVELALMAHTPLRRTIADVVAGTVVVNRPPQQPHRAPAFPMFSAKDEEFGPKP
jgi:uncharacterized RDD family membrane protein YckC